MRWALISFLVMSTGCVRTLRDAQLDYAKTLRPTTVGATTAAQASAITGGRVRIYVGETSSDRPEGGRGAAPCGEAALADAAANLQALSGRVAPRA